MTAGLDSKQIRVAPNGAIYAAAAGTPLPTAVDTPLASPWVNLGYASDDGVTLSRSLDIEEVNVWQSASPARYIVTKTSVSFGFSLVQFNADTLPLYFGLPSSAVTESGAGSGIFKMTVPADVQIDERAWCVESIDGDIHTRYIFQRGMITATDDLPLKRTEGSALPMTVSAMTATDGSLCVVLTDDPNLEP
jgi:hypothetical protein